MGEIGLGIEQGFKGFDSANSSPLSKARVLMKALGMA
jgi:hypothetical protein